MGQLTELGIALVTLGFILAFIAAIVLVVQGLRSGTGKARGAGVLLIGPIPIVFGSDRQSAMILVALSIALVVAAIMFELLRFAR